MRRRSYLSALEARLNAGSGFEVEFNNRLTPLQVTAASNIQTALLADEDSLSIDVATGVTETVTAQIPALSYMGLLTYEIEEDVADSWTVTAQQSLNSTNGTDGDWTSLTVTPIWGTPKASHLQKIDIPAGAQRWVKFNFTNGDAVTNPLLNVGLRKLNNEGTNDYWVIFGASLMEGNMEYKSLHDKAQTAYGCDPIIFNRAYSGKNIAYVLTNLASIIADHPNSRFFFMHIGGNDVSGTRPYEDTTTQERLDLSNDFDSLVEDLISTNRVPILTNLTFRDYDRDSLPSAIACYGGGMQKYGSLPYNENIIEPVIKVRTPKFYDFVNDRSLIDFYSYVLEDQTHLSTDGVHFSLSGKSFMQDHLVATAMKVVHDGSQPTPITRSTYNTPYEDAEYYVGIAEVSELAADIAVAQTWVDKLDDWTRDYTAGQIQTLQDRIDAIAPAAIKEFFIDMYATYSVGGNWNELTDRIVGTSDSNLTDSAGGASTIGVEITKAFNRTDSAGGLEAFGLPYDAMRDCLGHRNFEAEPAQIKFTGLSSSKTYEVWVFSNQDTTSAYTLDVYIDSVKKSVNPANNTTEIVKFTGLSADVNDEIIVDFDTEESYCFVNVVKLVEIG